MRKTLAALLSLILAFSPTGSVLVNIENSLRTDRGITQVSDELLDELLLELLDDEIVAVDLDLAADYTAIDSDENDLSADYSANQATDESDEASSEYTDEADEAEDTTPDVGDEQEEIVDDPEDTTLPSIDDELESDSQEDDLYPDDLSDVDDEPVIDLSALERGVTVVADDDSPTGFTATFVYHNPAAEEVILTGHMMLRDYYNRENTVHYHPRDFRPGLFPAGGDYLDTPMNYVGEGYWIYSVPLPGGGLPYWLIVDGVRTYDPYNAPPHPHYGGRRIPANEPYSVVHVPWHPTLQHPLNNRNVELPLANEDQRGLVQFVPYNSRDGRQYLGVYLPPEYDANRAEPYPVIFLSHGMGGDQTDWLWVGGVSNIMDNLIAQGLTEPAVVITMNQNHHDFMVPLPGVSIFNGPFYGPVENLMHYILPFVEAEFNVSNNPADRAVAGLSMGGAFATHLLVHYTDEFSYFGMMSGGGNMIPFPGFEDIPNIDIPTIFFGHGMFAPPFFVSMYQAFRNAMTEADLETTNYLVPAGHDQNTWSQLFTIFARDYLWQSEPIDVIPPAYRGVTVTADADSPTGYTATFVYHNPDAALVELVGLLNLRYIDGGATVRSPHEYEPGWFHAPGAGGNYIVQMDSIGGGYWTASVPVAGGTINYWYQLYTEETLTVSISDVPAEITAEFRSANSSRITDPYNCLSNFINTPVPLPTGVGNFRYSVIHAPFDAERQHQLNNRDIEMRRTDQRGTMHFVPYYTGDVRHYMGIYLPYGYDPDRAEPYNVIYTAHGLGGDLTDWLWQISAPNTLDNLIAGGVIPPTVLVTTSQIPFGFGVPFGQPRLAIVENLTNNVIPHVEEYFNVSVDPEERAFVGLSMGTSVVAHMYYEFTTSFGYYAFISGGNVPAFDFENLEDWDVPTLFMGHGLFEGGSNTVFPALADKDDIPFYVVPSGYGAHLFSIFARDYLWQTERITPPPAPRGVTVEADVDSPTGYTATFVYHNPDAVLVELGGDLMLRRMGEDEPQHYWPEEFEAGMFPVGGTNFFRDMDYLGNGYWTISVPLTGGGIAYWLLVYEDVDPDDIPPQPRTSAQRNALGVIRTYNPYNPPHTTNGDFRRGNNDVLSVVHVPWNSELQHELNNRYLELPRDDQRGTVQFVQYESFDGEIQYIGVYLPYGFDVNRAEAYPVIYLSHGVFGDQTDWMNAGGVPNVFDNLIASGVLPPTVAISINQNDHGWHPASPGWPGFGQVATTRFDRSVDNLIDNIMPFIEAEFNVSDRPEDRAKAGLSMGTAPVVQIIAEQTDVFGYYGLFSGSGNLNLWLEDGELIDIPGIDDVFIFHGYGMFAAPSSIAGYRRVSNYLSAAGVEHPSYAVPGAHDMNTWAQLLTIFARDYLWQTVRITPPPAPRGVTVTVDPDSPTGYTVTFVYYNPDATRVEVRGDMMMRDIDNMANTVRYHPRDYRIGLFPLGGAPNLHEPMVSLGGGYWTASFPMTGGGTGYWFQVWDNAENPDQSRRSADPYNMPPQTAGDFRTGNNNDVLSVVHAPWDSEKQHELNNRYLEMPRTDGQTGIVKFVPYYADNGENDWGRQYMGIYLPYGFDVDRTEAFRVVYASHGIFGDQTDWFNFGSAQHILDNLIADYDLEPTIFVTVNQNPFGFGFGGGGFNGRHPNPVENLRYNVMPFVEENFNASNSPENRSFVGLSMGGAVASHLLYEYTDEFAYFGLFSGGGDMRDRDLDELASRDLPTIVFGYGMFANSAQYMPFSNALASVEIEHALYRVPGGHSGEAWAQMFTIFARDYLWQTERITPPTKYEVTFYWNFEGSPTVPPVPVEYETAVGENIPPLPVREEHEFNGWQIDGQGSILSNEQVAEHIVRSNVEFVANWSKVVIVPVEYEVTFDWNFEGAPTVPPVPVEYGTAVGANIPLLPVRDEYEFNGWQIDGQGPILSNEQVAAYIVRSDVEFVADWSKVVIVPVEYEVTFNWNFEGAPTVPPALVEAGEIVTLYNIPEAPVRAGFIHIGWQNDGVGITLTNAQVAATRVTGDVEFVAVWIVVADPIDPTDPTISTDPTDPTDNVKDQPTVPQPTTPNRPSLPQTSVVGVGSLLFSGLLLVASGLAIVSKKEKAE